MTATSPIPLTFTDDQLAVLARNPEYKQFGGRCPVCLDMGEYRYQGRVLDCPDDDYGHPMLRLATLYWLHNIGLQYQTQIWSDYPHVDIREEIEEYIEKYEFFRLRGVGALFSSPTYGVGKTWGATHILKELVKQGVDGWFVPCWELYGYKDIEDYTERRFKLQKVQESELVVIDDIKWPYSERMTNYHGDKLEEFVRPRTDRNLSTIVTTNMTDKEFADTFPRVHSLLMAKSLVFELKGFDARTDGVVWTENVDLARKGETRPIQ